MMIAAAAAPEVGFVHRHQQHANYHSHHDRRASSIVSLSEEDNDDEIITCHRPAKKARTARDVRLEQNRRSARKSRMRKKEKETELRQNVDYYTRSNESLKEHNAELQLMLDEARAKIAGAVDSSYDSDVNKISCASPVTQLQEVTTAAAPITPLATTDQVQAPATSQTLKLDYEMYTNHIQMPVISHPSEQLDLPDDADAHEVVPDEATDDYIDILLENDDWWLTNNNNNNNNNQDDRYNDAEDIKRASSAIYALTQNQPERSQLEQVQSLPIVEAVPVKTESLTIPLPANDGAFTFPSNNHNNENQVHAVPAKASNKPTPIIIHHESRREKNRKAARKARMTKKIQHEKLQQSVSFYTRSNEMLKKKNEELQLLILQARDRCKVGVAAVAVPVPEGVPLAVQEQQPQQPMTKGLLYQSYTPVINGGDGDSDVNSYIDTTSSDGSSCVNTRPVLGQEDISWQNDHHHHNDNDASTNTIDIIDPDVHVDMVIGADPDNIESWVSVLLEQ